MSEHWTLRDMDNRGPDGDPWEVSGTPSDLIPYLDGPVRNDLSDPESGSDRLDSLIKAFRNEDLELAKTLGSKFAIYVSETRPLRLDAWCLFSKWGFGDGEIVDDYLWDNGHEEFDIRSAHATLCDLVERFLIPKIPGDFTTYRIETSHNPIRVRTWNGAEWDDHAGEAPDEVQDIYVEVPLMEVLKAIRPHSQGR